MSKAQTADRGSHLVYEPANWASHRPAARAGIISTESY